MFFSNLISVLSQLTFVVTDPSMVSAYMYPTGAPGAQAAPQAQAGPTTSPAYSSYQPTPTPGYQSVASQAPQSLPAISQPPQTSNIGYMGSQPMSMGYQPYNMQNLMTALPGQDASLPAQQPYIPGQQPLYQQMAPSTGPPQQQPPVAQPAPTQGPPAQGSEAQLISFD